MSTTLKTTIDPSAIESSVHALANLYAHPATSALREIIANAVDAHRESGNTSPVEVSLTTKHGSLEIVVKDNGYGMSRKDIGHYINISPSDKADNPDLIGGFGIGVLAVFSATSVVNIVTIKDGELTGLSGKSVNGETIEWDVVAQPAPRDTHGTTVAFTLPIKEAANISEQLHILAHTLPLAITVPEISETVTTYSPSARDLAIQTYIAWLAPVSPSVTTNDKSGTLTYCPYLLTTDTTHPQSTTDINHLLGEKLGVHALNSLKTEADYIRTEFMPSIAGIPYPAMSTLNKTDGTTFVATPTWYEHHLPDLELDPLPRSREYITHRTGTTPNVDDMKEKVVQSLTPAVTNNIEAVLNAVSTNPNYDTLWPKTTSGKNDDTTAAITHSQLTYIITSALFTDIYGRIPEPKDIIDINENGPAGSHISIIVNALIRNDHYARDIRDEIIRVAEQHSPHAVLASAHANTHGQIVEELNKIDTPNEPTTLVHVARALSALRNTNRTRNKYAKASGSTATADHDFNSRTETIFIDDTLPITRDASVDDRKALAALYGRSAKLVILTEHITPLDIALAEVATYLATKHATVLDRNVKHPSKPVLSKVKDATSNDQAPHFVWSDLTKKAQSGVKEKRWKYIKHTIKPDGTLSLDLSAAPMVTTSQLKEKVNDPAFIVIPKGEQVCANVAKKDKDDTSLFVQEEGKSGPTPMNPHFPLNATLGYMTRSGYAALHAHGVRTVLWVDSSTSLNEEVKGSWLTPWLEVAAPAIRKHAVELYTPYMQILSARSAVKAALRADALWPSLCFPSAAASDFTAAACHLDHYNPAHTDVLRVVNMLFNYPFISEHELSLMDEAVEYAHSLVSNTLPRLFTIPTALTTEPSNYALTHIRPIVKGPAATDHATSQDLASEVGAEFITITRAVNAAQPLAKAYRRAFAEIDKNAVPVHGLNPRLARAVVDVVKEILNTNPDAFVERCYTPYHYNINRTPLAVDPETTYVAPHAMRYLWVDDHKLRTKLTTAMGEMVAAMWRLNWDYYCDMLAGIGALNDTPITPATIKTAIDRLYDYMVHHNLVA